MQVLKRIALLVAMVVLAEGANPDADQLRRHSLYTRPWWRILVALDIRARHPIRCAWVPNSWMPVWELSAAGSCYLMPSLAWIGATAEGRLCSAVAFHPQPAAPWIMAR